jgi:hypothetical protein
MNDTEDDGRITLREILRRQVVRVDDGWNWLRVMLNDCHMARNFLAS